MEDAQEGGAWGSPVSTPDICGLDQECVFYISGTEVRSEARWYFQLYILK